jgi:hypothetical protein
MAGLFDMYTGNMQPDPNTGRKVKGAATQAGLLGLGFAPGAGMADYLGYFPAAGGGYEPGAVENFRQGNYGTAAMQLLGAGGDAMYAVPLLGATAGSLMKAPRAAQKAMKAAKGAPAKTEFDLAHEAAQRNAALPVEQGGLGLPPDNTAMDRARAMGFDTDSLLYHGTNADIGDFRLGMDSPGHTTGAQASESVFMTPDPANASGWALAAQSRPDPYIDSLFRAVDNKKLPKAERAAARKALKEHMAESYVSGKTVYPVHIRPGETTTYDMKGKSYRDVPTGKQPDALVKKSKKKGGDTVVIENMYDPPVPGWGGPWNATQVSVNDPKNIRSRFAAFDPMKRNSSNILAGVGAGGIGLGGLLFSGQDEPQY